MVRERLNEMRGRRGLRYLIVAALGATAIVVISTWLYGRYSHVYVSDARVSANIITVSSRLAGWVTEFPAAEGSLVSKGEVLVRIDARDAALRLAELEAELATLRADRARAEANVKMVDAQTESQVRAMESRLDAVQAALASAEADLEMAEADFARAESLFERKVISRQRWEADRRAVQNARQERLKAIADVAAARAGLEEARAERARVGVLRQEITMFEHRIEQVETQRDRQALEVADREIKSPVDGIVDETFVDPGEYVVPGQRLLLVHDPNDVWISTNVKETEIRFIKLGAHAAITVDAFPGKTFEGQVTRIGTAATSEFALLPSPNPSGTFTKVTQRLSVKIELDEPDGILRPGMMVEVAIDIPGR